MTRMQSSATEILGSARVSDALDALGVSGRTLRRRIAQVQEELGATSRFQAGLQAGRRGWR